jgi:DNA-directed RNA polymerase specialized sigma subunit
VDVREMLKMYPWIDQEIKKLNKKLNDYLEMQEETRNNLRANVVDGMPHGAGMSDSTYKAVEGVIDLYGQEINRLTRRIQYYWDIKEMLDKAFSALTLDEMQIIEMYYSNNMSLGRIGYKLYKSKTQVFREKQRIENKISENII